MQNDQGCCCAVKQHPFILQNLFTPFQGMICKKSKTVSKENILYIDEDTAEDYYTEEKVSSAKKKRGRKPKAEQEDGEEDGEENGDGDYDDKPRKKRATKKSKKALDAEGIDKK